MAETVAAVKAATEMEMVAAAVAGATVVLVPAAVGVEMVVAAVTGVTVEKEKVVTMSAMDRVPVRSRSIRPKPKLKSGHKN